MKKIEGIVVALVLPMVLASCFEDSTVIKVGKNGEGLVHIREYSSTKDTEESVTLPGEEKLLAKAAAMGKGVKLVSFKKSQNPKGWFGHEEIYEFSDINNLTIHTQDKDDRKDEDLYLTFLMEDGSLDVRWNNEKWKKMESRIVVPQGPTIDPYANTTGPKAEGVSIKPVGLDLGDEGFEKMAEGMRVGVFLQIDEPLKETNATYRNGSLFTLLNADMETIAKSGKLSSASDLEGESREEMKEIEEMVPGFELDLQEPVRFIFK